MKRIYILFTLTTLFFSLIASGQTLSKAQKEHMIDSAFDARTERYLRRCFPEYTIHIEYKEDSFALCSIETVLLVAPAISERQMPLLERYMITMANYYVTRNELVHFDYGMFPVDIDENFDRMFNRKEIYVGAPDGADSHERVNHLFSVFNRITEDYMSGRADLK